MRLARKHLLFLVFGLYAALVLPRSTTFGMFQDGVVFASVARNMAEGVGEFWTPRFTDTAYQLEAMHPPLGAWILSNFFRWFGDSPRIEVLYGVGLGIANLGLLALLWRTVTRPVGQPHDAHLRAALERSPVEMGAWLPLLIYVAMPITSHSYTSNLLENPMTSFLLLAMTLGHLAVASTRLRNTVLAASAFGALIFLAVQTKGPPGLFVLVYPSLAGLFVPVLSRRRGLAVSALGLITGLVLAAVVILPNPAAIEFTRQHYGGLVLDALVGGKIPSQGRFSALQTLVQETTVPAFLIGMLSWRLRVKPRFDPDRRDLLFALTGLAGVLPFLITTHQYSRYAFPALPMMAIALALFAIPVGVRVESVLSRPRPRGVVAALSTVLVFFGVASAFKNAGTVRKHEAFHLDFSAQPLELEGRPLFSVCPDRLATDWVLVGDVQRHLRASLTVESGHAYWLTEISEDCRVPPDCSLLHPAESTTYRLYRCSGGP